jgi:ABC-type branched-subunit amino acid transport system permease subunit
MSDQTPARSLLDSAWLGRIGILVLGLTIFGFPLIGHSDYRLYLDTQVGIHLLVAMGLNLLSGYAGQPSLCHGALLAVGHTTGRLASSFAPLYVDRNLSFTATENPPQRQQEFAKKLRQYPEAGDGAAGVAAAPALLRFPALREADRRDREEP